MFLKRLELQGFKSFADKVAFEFPGGITAIVGPNGSGKSNVTDGVRWLLGEREARNLRGAKVEDLIFAGSEAKPRLGQAQASLFFDNSSGFFQVDFKEVSISRKVSRDGISQFFLNKAEVRLKDIIDFFAKSRLGARGLNVVGQGESDVFIKATPLERRLMIEEILGLKEYQIKKEDAKRRLKNSLVNLDKVNALIDELKPHLRFLRKQISRYQGREELSARLKKLEDDFYGSRLKQLSRESQKIEPALGELAKEIVRVEKSLEKAKGDLEAVKKSEPEANLKIKDIKSERSALLDKKAALQKELGRAEMRIELAATEAHLESAELIRVLKEIERISLSLAASGETENMREGIKRILNLVQDLFKKSSPQGEGERERVVNDLTRTLKGIDVELEKLGESESSFTSSLESFNEDFKQAFLVMEAEEEKLKKLGDERNHLLLGKERVDLKLKDIDYELTEVGRPRLEFDNWSGEAEWDEEHLRREMFKLRGELTSIGEVDEALVTEAKETEERYDFLKGQVNDLEKAFHDLKALIKELDYKIHHEFTGAVRTINDEFTKFVRLMFGGGKARLVIQQLEKIEPVETSQAEGEGLKEKSKTAESENGNGDSQEEPGVEIELTLPKKRIKGLEVLSGGERSLVSTAALFALISVSPPPFLVLDEIDAALDERNARRFGELLKDFARSTQFVIITHNRATMEVADALYGITMSPDGTSQVLSLKLQS
ncbi:MAG: AAA family ATPase [Candidatus Colwellbacteria bacterium]|nr:AAA family ATPase [Candidatus Colwellbacteria bacterium]